MLTDETIATIDNLRVEANARLDPALKGKLGQFMTPAPIAEFMAGLFSVPNTPARLLDCGAGVGSLTASAIRRLKSLECAELWEIDPIMRGFLEEAIKPLGVPYKIHEGDFILDAVLNHATNKGNRFTRAILNPPYKKINSDSLHRLLLRKIGIETVNLYTAFLALAILLLEEGGEAVAIIPRSFCNGPYYKPFRTHLLRYCSIEHIHVFESRQTAFKDDEVLQENIILKLTKGKEQGTVKVSISHDPTLSDYEERSVPFEQIVKPEDDDHFIHIPTGKQEFDHARFFKCALNELNLEVCTGPVVDFRLREFWQQEPHPDSIPLIYPHHFVNRELVWPKEHKKPNALAPDREVSKWLMPSGCYVIVKRFSAKEERRRVVAYVVYPEQIKSTLIGFENHWNVFHWKKKGLDPTIAQGLACFLNSTELDNYFRVFSGHTQVNATDLRNMKYPPLAKLKNLGIAYKASLTQEEIDALLQKTA